MCVLIIDCAYDKLVPFLSHKSGNMPYMHTSCTNGSILTIPTTRIVRTVLASDH
jgi:hypothetical protein